MAETGRLISVSIEDEMKTDYLTYAMSVIVARALPDVRDGLKPVHRRILYAMDELGLRYNASTKKCARITGDAMGKYHPHGDFSLYDALVRMAQDFSLRYPLVYGQGNFGSIDGDPAAASRYTEAKLSRFGEEMLTDLDKDTVAFGPNYDESLKEPLVLPSAFPNLLVNGSSGIAVGMATNMAPHNLLEVGEAIAAYIENPDIDLEGLMRHIKGPDFPTGGIIFGSGGIRDAYTTGRGKVVVRGKFILETMKNGREQIVFTEIPYAVNKTTLITRIADLVRDKVLEGVSDLRDESDREGLRIVLELKKGAIPKLVLNRLFTHTALQSTFGVINLALVEGRPKCLSLKELIHYFVKHRIDVVTRRSRYELRKAEERAHILRGLVIALSNIDEVVAIIKASKNVELARTNLQKRFDLSEIQAQAIVDMRLGRLTSLETEKVLAELADIEARISYLQGLLASDAMILDVVKNDTLEIAKKYGDTRRTEIVIDDLEAINIEDLIKPEEMAILISNKGFIKRVSVHLYRSQGRGGKGSNSANLLEEDFVQQLFVANTHDHLLFITSAGKAYWLKVHEIPESSRQARGAHIKSLLAISPDEEITTVIDFKHFSGNQYLLMGTLRGVVKKVSLAAFVNAKTRGIIAIHLDEGDRLVSACLTGGQDEVMLITRKGQALRIHEKQVRSMGRASRGVRGIRLSATDELATMLRVNNEQDMALITINGYGKRVAYSSFNAHGRGTGGQMIYVPDDVSGEIVGAVSISEEDEAMLITSQGKTIKIQASTVRVMGKGARGVRVVNIDPPDFVIGLDKIISDEIDPEDLKSKEALREAGVEAPEDGLDTQVALDGEAGTGAEDTVPGEAQDKDDSLEEIDEQDTEDKDIEE
ncbi:MAG: DNA topoisomerase (ATP-hydrolyzing) subunit A [Spirochaetia bacterium]|jgi:DNA gyrase subunit A|nr:DNA topoisomerase (ATP-hydrolyzing) subunit A [Spirochaetia bacterium]